MENRVISLSRPDSKLEIVVSRRGLDELPDNIVKIVLAEDGVQENPKRKMYKYNIDTILDLKTAQVKISPGEYTVSIGKNTFYIHSKGIVRLTLSNGELVYNHYANNYKFMNVYRVEQEKKNLKEKTAHW